MDLYFSNLCRYFSLVKEGLQNVINDSTISFPAIDSVRDEPYPNVADRLRCWRVQVEPWATLDNTDSKAFNSLSIRLFFWRTGFKILILVYVLFFMKPLVQQSVNLYAHLPCYFRIDKCPLRNTRWLNNLRGFFVTVWRGSWWQSHGGNRSFLVNAIASNVY
jgi:hypothetical protein